MDLLIGLAVGVPVGVLLVILLSSFEKAADETEDR